MCNREQAAKLSFVLLCTLWRNQSSYLLLSVDSQTSAGNRKLYNKYHEQDDHVLSFTVKEQQQWTHCRHWTCIILLIVSVTAALHKQLEELIYRNISANSKKIESVCKVVCEIQPSSVSSPT